MTLQEHDKTLGDIHIWHLFFQWSFDLLNQVWFCPILWYWLYLWCLIFSKLCTLTLLYAGPCYHNTPLHTYYYHFNRNGSKELKIWWQFSIDSSCRMYKVYFHNSLLKIFEIWHGSKLVSLDYAQKRGKFNFFHFLCNKPYFFFLNLNFTWKMRSFDVHNVDVG